MIDKSNTKIGYALGGGGAPGLSHIGVLKVLHEYGIRPCTIAGTSIGAIIGALYAEGLKAKDVEHIVSQLDWKRMARLADFTIPINGLFQGKRVISLLESILGNLTFSQLKCDFACVTTDVVTGEQVVLYDGSLIEAIRASISVPGIFTPVRIDGRYLVDGGLVNEIPVSVCRERGAEYVIGVNVIPDPSKTALHSRKGHVRQASSAPTLEMTGDEASSSISSTVPISHLRARIDNIDDSINKFLLYHSPKRQRGAVKLSDSQQIVKPQRLVPKAPTLFDVLRHSINIAEYTVAVENLKGADLAISPNIEDIGFWQFDKGAQAIAAGEAAARLVLEQGKLTSKLSPL